MAENTNNANGANAPEETKKGFFTKVKDSISDFSEKHPKATKAAKVAGKVFAGVALVFTGAFVGGVATGIKAERQRGKSEEETVEETVDLPDPEYEAPVEETEEVVETSFEDNAPEEEQAEE